MTPQPARRRASTFATFLSCFALFVLIFAAAACGGGGSSAGGGGTGGTGGGGTGGGGGASTPRAFNGDFAVRLPSQNGYGADTSVVYDQPLKEIFVSNTAANEVEAYSSVDGRFVGALSIPGASGLSLAPDNSKLYIGTTTAYIYSADPTTLRVTSRIAVPASYIVPDESGNTQLPALVYALADGSVFVGMGANDYSANGYGASGPIQYLLYDPSSASFKLDNPPSIGGGLPARSFDGTALLVPTDGGVRVYSSSTHSYSAGFTLPWNIGHSLYANADGSQFAVSLLQPNAPGSIIFLDKSLNQQNSLTLPNLQESAAVFSRDGSQLFTIYVPGIAISINTQTAAITGYLGVDVAGESVPNYQDVDENNHLFGLTKGSLIAFNTSSMQSAAPAAVPDFSEGVFSVNQVEGPLTGGTQVTFVSVPTENADNGVESSSQAYFASVPATQNTVAGYEGSTMNALTSTSPATTTPGPVGLVITDAKNDAAFLPDAFTFGPHILRVQPNTVGIQGGDMITITAYGLGFFEISNNEISVGGTPVDSATIKLDSYAGFNYPEQTLTFPAPAGKPGWADIVLTLESGDSTTLKRGVQYLQTESNLSGDPYTNAVYDSTRDRFYLTGADANVGVYDVASNAFLAPLTSAKVGSSDFLNGLALTPDNSKLLVADTNGRQLVVFDLTANTSTAISTALPSDPPPTSAAVEPGFVQVVANNIALVEMQFCAKYQIREVDLAKGTVKGRTEGDTDCGPVTGFPQWGQSSADGSVALLSGTPGDASPTPPARVWEFHENNDSITGPTILGATAWQGGTPVVNSDGSVLITGAGVVDQRLLPLAPLVTGAIDEQLNSSGSLLVGYGYLQQNTTLGLTIQDTHNGQVLLTAPMPSIFGAKQTKQEGQTVQTHPMDSNQLGFYVHRPLAMSPAGDKILYANINGGVTYLELSVVPLAVGTITPPTGATGTEITVRGSGFVSGTTVKIGGSAAACTMTDSETLSCSVPNLPAGPAAMSLANPDGQTYSFDYAFVVQ